MTELKGVGRRKTLLLDGMRNRRRYWELMEEVEYQEIIEHKEETQVIFHKSNDLLISSILNNNNNNNNNSNNNNNNNFKTLPIVISSKYYNYRFKDVQ